MKKVVVVSLILTIILGGCSQISSEKKEIVKDELYLKQRKEDFDYLFTTISENYPFLHVNQRINGIDWESNYEKYLQMVTETGSDEEFFYVLSEILKDLNNGHTYMLTKEQVEHYRYSYMNTETWLANIYKTLNNNNVLQRYGLESLKTEEEQEEEKQSSDSNPPSENLKNAKVEDILEGKVAYINIPQMIPLYTVEQDENFISNYLTEIQGYQALVIDIRGNSGGSTPYWTDFLLPKILNRPYTLNTYYFLRDGKVAKKYMELAMAYPDGPEFTTIDDLNYEQLSNLPHEVIKEFGWYFYYSQTIEPAENSIMYQGNIYLLVDRFVYSASEAFAVFAKETEFATLIGEKTGGDGIGINPWIEKLPNSGYVFSFPLMLGTISDGTINEEHKTMPDYEVNAARGIFGIENDECIQKVLELEGITH